MGENANFQETLRPRVYYQIREALQQDVSPILLLGAVGTGKTTILKLLQRDWKQRGVPVFWLSLRRIFREADIVAEFRRTLSLDRSTSEPTHPRVVGSSAGRALQLTVEAIDSLKSPPLMLLDGLDEARDPELILRFVRLLSRQTRSSIVVSSREMTDAVHYFSATFRTEILSNDQILEIIEEENPESLNFSPAQRASILEAIRGSPLLASLWAREFETFRKLLVENERTTPEKLIEAYIRSKIGELTDATSAVHLLVLLALRGSVPAGELGALGLDPAPLISSGLLSENDDRIGLAHTSFAPEVFRIAGILPASGTILRDLKFGAEEAERDRLLHDNFIELRGFTSLVNGEKNIVIGDRGTGKSAIFAQLGKQPALEPEQVARSKIQVIRITHPKETLNKLEANGSELRTAEQFRAGWLTLAAYALAENLELLSPAQRKIAKGLRATLSEETEPSNRVAKVFRELWKWRSAIKIKIGPIAIEPAGSSGKGHGNPIDLLSFIKSTADELREAQRSVAIAIDRIDEIHKYDRSLQEKAVQGLFMAEAELAQNSGVTLLIFLRSDLFNIYRIEEKNKLVSRRLAISWERSDLLEFIIDRVLANDCLAGLRAFVEEKTASPREIALRTILPEQIESVPAVDWLWDCMQNGNGDVSPRQLILLLLQAGQSPAGGAQIAGFPVFPASALQWSMDRLSELSFKELVDDFQVAPTFLANCRAGKIETFHLDKVKDLFGPDDGAISLQVDLLERLGFLERVVEKQPDGIQSTLFRVPKLFTRSWT
jgi:GTPase SAR1 family protein